MQTKRKLQLGAAAVIINATVALLALHSGAAIAGSCTTLLTGCTIYGECQTNPTAWCQSLQPGCTVTGNNFCVTGICADELFYECHYNP
jgi:hypothetical protein